MREVEREMITAINYYLSGGDRESIFLGNTMVYRNFRSCHYYLCSEVYKDFGEDNCKATVTLFNNVIAYVTENYLYFTPQYTSNTTKSRLNALITAFTNSSISFCSEDNGSTMVLQNFSTDFDCIPYGKADTKQVTRKHRPSLIIPEYIHWVRLPRKYTSSQVILYK